MAGQIACKHIRVETRSVPLIRRGFWGTLRHGLISGYDYTAYRCADCKSRVAPAFTAITEEEAAEGVAIMLKRVK